jgi:hypothetical protein
MESSFPSLIPKEGQVCPKSHANGEEMCGEGRKEQTPSHYHVLIMPSISADLMEAKLS